jgi:hypothetical protein
MREPLYRLAVCSLSNAYRYRPILHTAAGLAYLREFPADARLESGPRGDPFRPIALWGGERHQVPEAAKRGTFDLFPPQIDSFMGRMQAGTVGEITHGPHVAVEMGLLRRAVEVLRAGGVAVAIVEGPLHPAAADLYDRRLRGEFLAFARSLAREPGVVFRPLEESEPYYESDFADLVHLGPEGVPKLTRAMVAGLESAGLKAAR